MKIVFVVDDYSGGAGNIIQLLSTEYAKMDEVYVLLTHQTSDKRYECLNVKFHELSANKKPSGALKKVLFQIRWLKNEIKEIQPDVVISFLTINNIFIGLGQLHSKLPIISCERICPSDLSLKFPWNLLMNVAYWRADMITVQFSEFTSLYNGKYEDKCAVTPNYIAKPDRFKSVSDSNEKRRLISCGRLNASKQFDVMLEMFSEIHRRNPDTELFIYGRGPYEEQLRKRIDELGLSDAAFLKGYTNDTYGVLCDSDIYLMSSKSEGFPNALSEALAVGLPSVAFRCNPGIDELSDYGRRCAVIDVGDRQAFMEAVLDLCANTERSVEYSKNAKEVTKVYSLDKVKKSWDDCIESAIKNKQGR